jgi:hypothetical protein
MNIAKDIIEKRATMNPVLKSTLGTTAGVVGGSLVGSYLPLLLGASPSLRHTAAGMGLGGVLGYALSGRPVESIKKDMRAQRMELEGKQELSDQDRRNLEYLRSIEPDYD